VKIASNMMLSVLVMMGCLSPSWLYANSQHKSGKAKNAIGSAVTGIKLPSPGTYKLPVIQEAGNGWVLDGNRFPWRLSRYTEGALTLLSFMYTYCSDPLGCPLAYATMQDIERRVIADPSLHGKVRLVSLSFDPTNDTPDMMKLYGRIRPSAPQLRWHFLTTYSTRFLQPILAEFGQDIEVELSKTGAPTRMISHMLKAFLIDVQGHVREIYSTAYMNPELIFNDIKTLAIESQKR
jgi:protein SCO1